jgi:hypothetical protein
VRVIGAATGPGDGRGPSLAGIAALVLAALALLATTPPIPSVEGHAIGEVTVGSGESVDRVLEVHLEATGVPPTRGFVYASLQAASGLERWHDSEDVTVTLLPAPDADTTSDPATAVPVERCAEGCDLEYRVRIEAGPDNLPGSVIRYVATVRFEYGLWGSGPDPDVLRIDLEGSTSGPAAPVWSILAGVLALVVALAGWASVDRLLGQRRRNWPALGLIALAVLGRAWPIVMTVLAVAGGTNPELLGNPWNLVLIMDPWSTGLLLVLAWGVWRGLRRWDADDGWLLGLAAVASVGLGGLWAAWWITATPAVQPIALSLPFVVLGGLGGTVIGQAWRGSVAHRDRGWAAVALLAHGVIIAGFAFLAWGYAPGPIDWAPAQLLFLVPALLVALAFRRWLGGRRRWLVLFDLLVACAGLLGILVLTTYPFVPLAGHLQVVEIQDVAVGLAIGASLVAFGTSLHAMPRRGVEGDPIQAEATPPDAMPGLAGDPPTT